MLLEWSPDCRQKKVIINNIIINNKQLKLWMFLICFALGFDSSEGKKCCVSRAYAVCVGWPQIFGKTPLLLTKKLLLIIIIIIFLFSYFHCSLIGYFLGLLTATVSSEVFKAAQPALLYLVPFTLLPLLTMAYLKVE